jgi:hypothetical protein
MRRRGPGSGDLPAGPDTDLEELSLLLEETVESLAAAVVAWRTEIGRTAERTQRLEDAVDALTGAMESLKTQVVRAEDNANDKLEQVTDVLESGLVENRSTADDIRELLGSSAASLVRTIEDWKGELRYGVELGDAKMLAAVEKLETEMRLLRGSLEERSNAVAESTRAFEERLLKGLQRSVEIFTGSLGGVKDEIEASITSLSGTVVTSHESLTDNVSRLGSSISQTFHETMSSAADAERKLLLSLEALESGIDVSLTARQEFESRVLSRLEGLEDSLSQVDDSSSERQRRFEGVLEALAANLEAWHREDREIVDKSGRHGLEDKILMRLDEVDIRMAQAARESNDRQERLAGSMSSLSDSLEAWWAHAPDLPPDLVALQGFGRNLVRRFEDLESKLLAGQVQSDLRNQRLENYMIDLANSVNELRTKGLDATGRTTERIIGAVQAIEDRISAESHRWSAREVGEVRSGGSDNASIRALGDLVSSLSDGLTWLRSNASQYDTLMRGLEELDLGLLRNRDDLAVVADGLASRISRLEQRLEQSLATEMERLERNVAERTRALASAIIRTREKVDEGADSNHPPFGDSSWPSEPVPEGDAPPPASRRKGTRRR